jgi:3',5'-cyclic AMP phosphodiesterase CpdA
MSTSNLSRRDALGTLGAAAATLAGAPLARAASSVDDAPRPAPPAPAPLRVAHITDMHVDANKGSEQGLAACLDHIHARTLPVDLVINTGDTVMCVNGVDEAAARTQWDIAARTFDARCRLPVLHCIGNHDSWTWGDPAPDAPRRGKGWCLEALKMPGRYYRRDVGAWSFIALDSVTPVDAKSYTGRLDPDQAAWLAAELAAIPAARPVCILSHIPILTACGFFDGQRLKGGQWTIPGSWMHEDALALTDLFLKHPNVKTCLSGHMHQVERIDFQAVSYICSGAVSAGWWGGTFRQCDYGYSLVELFPDGRVEFAYETFGWATRG